MFKFRQPVLVVDEDPHMRALVASIVKNAGLADTVGASSVEDALREIQIRPPAAIVTEAKLGLHNGLALVRWTRRAPDSPDRTTPVLVLTGRSHHGLIVGARDAGAHGVIAKPVAPDTLTRKLASAILHPRKFVDALSYVGPCRRVRAADRYIGRRLDDDDDPRLTSAAHCERLAVPVHALATAAKPLDPTSRSQVLAIRSSAGAVDEEARAANDQPLSEAAGSLTRFVDACGLSGLLDEEIVDVHVATMRNLTNAERRREQRDHEVIAGLHKVVARRLIQFGAAPPAIGPAAPLLLTG